MRSIYGALVLIILLGTFLFWVKGGMPLLKEVIDQDGENQESGISEEPNEKTDQGIDIELETRTIRVVWQDVVNTAPVELIANFTEKSTATELRERYNCSLLVNAGFYMEDGRPTGLFSTRSSVVRDYQSNNLFNGVVFSTDEGGLDITSINPRIPYKWAFQTGPYIMRGGEPEELALANDKKARRMMVATTSDNRTFFIVFFDPKTVYSGPYLGELPQVLSEFAAETGFVFIDAVNLDGGSASAFLSDDVQLVEASPIGGFFCVKYQ